MSTDENEAISFVFPDINYVQQCSQRAIITGTNHVVDALNKMILTMLHGEEFPLFNITWLCSDDAEPIVNRVSELSEVTRCARAQVKVAW